jgi:hypothetical protein
MHTHTLQTAGTSSLQSTHIQDFHGAALAYLNSHSGQPVPPESFERAIERRIKFETIPVRKKSKLLETCCRFTGGTRFSQKKLAAPTLDPIDTDICDVTEKPTATSLREDAEKALFSNVSVFNVPKDWKGVIKLSDGGVL